MLLVIKVAICLLASVTLDSPQVIDLSTQCAVLPSLRGSGPRVVSVPFEKERLYMEPDMGSRIQLRLGKLPVSSTTDIKLAYKNKYPGNLKIDEVQSSCGCVVGLESNTEMVGPNEIGTVVLRVTVPAVETDFARTITVKFHESENGNKPVTLDVDLQGTVVNIVSLFPPAVDLSLIPDGVRQSALSINANFPDIDLSKFAITTSERVIKGLETRDANKFSVNVNVLYSDFSSAPFDEWAEEIKLTTDAGLSFSVPFQVSLRGKYHIRPKSISIKREDGAIKNLRVVIATTDESEKEFVIDKIQYVGHNNIFADVFTISEPVFRGRVAVMQISCETLPKAVLNEQAESRLEFYVSGRKIPLCVPIVVDN